jgi:hypothetical protein
VEDYFFDNQVLEVNKELIVVGYKHTWKIMQSNGKATKQGDGISQNFISRDVIMPQ